jgi:hypothetical protein
MSSSNNVNNITFSQSQKKEKIKKHKNKENKENKENKKKMKEKLHKDELSAAFIKSIKTNKWFYFTLFICFSMFKFQDFIVSSKPSSYTGFVFSFIFILLFGHIMHRLSHNIDFTQVYNHHKKGNMNAQVDSVLIKVCDFLDFHRKTHHDSSINKKPINIFYEFINNFITQGGGLVLFSWFCNRCIDMRIILLWALMYATAHNINYMIMKPSVHRDHHLHEDTNYGLDVADIIFDTKYDLNDIENYNHISINLIVITLIIIFFNTASWLFMVIKQRFLV